MQKAEGMAANPLGTDKIGRLILKFSIPAIISMLVNAVYNIVDQIFIGWSPVGLLGIAATNVALPITTVCTALALLFGVGGAANFNLKLGEGKKEDATRYMGNTMGLMAISGVVLGVLVLLFLEPLMHAFGATPNVLELALAYTAIIAPGIPFTVFATGAAYLIRADGSPRYAMFTMVAGAVFNLVFDPIFLFVFDMGIEGIALATTLGQILSCGLSVFYLVRKMRSQRPTLAQMVPKARYTGHICALGMGSGINQISMMVVQIVMNITLRHYGASSAYGNDIPLAVVGAVTKLTLLFLSFTIGIGQGIQPLASYNYGAKNYKRVKDTLKKALLAASVISVISWLVFQIFPGVLVQVFGESGELYMSFAVPFLRAYSLMLFVGGIQPVASNFFSAIGKARRGVLVSLTKQILFTVPLLVILPIFMGLDGVKWANPISDAAAALVAAILIVNEVRHITALQRQTEAQPEKAPA